MESLRFNDGSAVSAERAEEIALAVELAARSLRLALRARDGEVRVGLAKRHFLPVLWSLTQKDGVGVMGESFEFAGITFYLS